MPKSNDYELAILASTGDVEAFEQLVELYFTGILSVCYSVVGNKQDAEDCTQEAFIKAYRNITKYESSASFFTWIYRIAINTCYDLKRKQKRTPSVSTDEETETEDGYLFFQLEDKTPLPDQQIINNYSDKKVHEIIDKLPDKHSRILRLKDIEGLSYQEISRIENINEGTVKSRLARARMTFAKFARQEDLYDI